MIKGITLAILMTISQSALAIGHGPHLPCETTSYDTCSAWALKGNPNNGNTVGSDYRPVTGYNLDAKKQECASRNYTLALNYCRVVTGGVHRYFQTFSNYDRTTVRHCTGFVYSTTNLESVNFEGRCDGQGNIEWVNRLQ